MAQSQVTGPDCNASEMSEWAGRLLDIMVASIGLVIASPVIALTALALWIEGGRPIFFAQRRLGRFGRPFQIYKFRKFDPAASGNGPLTVKDDPRLTGVGRLIEKWKINELPQLWNVMRGDMSVVGPRPETVNFADCFSPNYLGVLNHKPGIFGPAQVLFRDEASLYPVGADTDRFYRETLFPLKASIDLAYFSRRTVLSDLTWILRGVFAVVAWRCSQDSVSQIMKLREAFAR